MSMPVRLIMALLSLVFTSISQAAATDIQQQIDEAIELYVTESHTGHYQDVAVEIQPIDPRLRLAACGQALQLQHRPRNRSTGRLTFKVTCAGPDSWSIHVPVTVQAFDHVVISDLPIAKGTHLSPSDLRLELVDVSLLHGGYFQSMAELDGFVAKRPIQAEQVMTPALVDPARMINRGEKVMIVAEGPGLSIRATGLAMEDGAYGELIRVRNTNSNKVVEGRITAPGLIKVSL
ncbi:flagellar basal body P-ring formation chaperone FlgA [Ketobacter sp.]|uniref:flagellar basal body P-ring formation chaperone FlgA n=1 Tax=Ketobacter sp. TaxID=2083498 RepID=UPI0025BD6D8B|nr:flagellar basal body P-ring formation chaperone FlgA [Ketobacter sp.]